MSVGKKFPEDFDPAQATRLLERIQQEITPGKPADGPTPKTAPASSPAEDEPGEPSRPTCYLKEFKDW